MPVSIVDWTRHFYEDVDGIVREVKGITLNELEEVFDLLEVVHLRAKANEAEVLTVYELYEFDGFAKQIINRLLKTCRIDPELLTSTQISELLGGPTGKGRGLLLDMILPHKGDTIAEKPTDPKDLGIHRYVAYVKARLIVSGAVGSILEAEEAAQKIPHHQLISVMNACDEFLRQSKDDSSPKPKNYVSQSMRESQKRVRDSIIADMKRGKTDKPSV